MIPELLGSKNSQKIFVPADKTKNMYGVEYEIRKTS